MSSLQQHSINYMYLLCSSLCPLYTGLEHRSGETSLCSMGFYLTFSGTLWATTQIKTRSLQHTVLTFHSFAEPNRCYLPTTHRRGTSNQEKNRRRFSTTSPRKQIILHYHRVPSHTLAHKLRRRRTLLHKRKTKPSFRRTNTTLHPSVAPASQVLPDQPCWSIAVRLSLATSQICT